MSTIYWKMDPMSLRPVPILDQRRDQEVLTRQYESSMLKKVTIYSLIYNVGHTKTKQAKKLISQYLNIGAYGVGFLCQCLNGIMADNIETDRVITHQGMFVFHGN